MKRIQLNMDSLATLLFTLNVSKIKGSYLDNEEWYTVERIIRVNGLKGPSALFDLSYEELIDVLDVDEYTAKKIINRLDYLPNLLTYLSSLESRGINVCTKYEEGFPKTLNKSIKKRAPSYIFYSGDIGLVNDNVSIVSLHECGDKETAYVRRIVDKIKYDNYTLVCSDAKGAPLATLNYALHHNVKCCLFVCDKYNDNYNQYKKYINSGKLVLLCCEDVEGGFSVTKAIDRNIYICGISKYQIVINSKINSGANWFTSLQNMHHHWTELLVLDIDDLGNQRLLEMNATPLRVKDILSDLSFDIIHENNHIDIKKDAVDIDQMTIFEFIGE